MFIAVFDVLHPIHERAAERLGRQYILAVDDLTLTTLRGGRNRGFSLHIEHFDTPDELQADVEEKLKRRIYHGYVLTWWSAECPWLEWLQARECPIQRRESQPVGIQLELPIDR